MQLPPYIFHEDQTKTFVCTGAHKSPWILNIMLEFKCWFLVCMLSLNTVKAWLRSIFERSPGNKSLNDLRREIYFWHYFRISVDVIKLPYRLSVFTLRTYAMQGEHCNREKIRLWDFYIFIRFEVSGIHLCYFYSDVCMCVCMWVNTIASKRCIQLSSYEFVYYWSPSDEPYWF